MRPTFQKNAYMLGVKEERTFMNHAKKRYYQILKDIPEYGENDVLLVNLISASMLAAIYLNLDNKPNIDTLADYYELSMNTNPIMKIFLKRSDQYTPQISCAPEISGGEKSEVRQSIYMEIHLSSGRNTGLL